MKIGIAQISTRCGDFPGNAKRILAAYRECVEDGAELVLTPQLSLCGGDPGDLVARKNFVPKCLQALDYLSDEARMVPLIIGHVSELAGRAHSSLSHVFQGRVYPLKSRPLTETKETCLNVRLTSDLLGLLAAQRNVQSFPSRAGQYLQFSFSPYYHDEINRKSWRPGVVCQPVGLYGENLCAGGSAFVGKDGVTLRRMLHFKDQCEVIDTNASGFSKWIDLDSDEQLFEALVYGLREWVSQYLGQWSHDRSYPSYYIHWDGSMESELTYAITQFAFGGAKIWLTGQPDGQVRVDVTPIEEARRSRLLIFSPKSRTTLALGDKSEAIDTVCHFAPLGDLSESAVRRVQDVLRRRRDLVLLGGNQAQQYHSGHFKTAEDVDAVLELYAVQGLSADEITKRTGLPEHSVRWVQRRFDSSRAARRRGLPTLRLSAKGFGIDQRCPMVHAFTD